MKSSRKLDVRLNVNVIEEENVCPDCGSTNLTIDSGRAEISCKRCGLVIQESIMDRGREWRAFDKDQVNKRARTGAPMKFAISDKGLTTDIDWKNRDIHGNSIPERNQSQIYRLRKWNKKLRISGTGERNLALALSELDRQSSRLGIPRSVREDTALIYREAARKNIVRGRSIEGMVAASVYTACRRCGVPRTLDEVSQASKITKKKIGKNYRFLARELKIKLMPTSPADYVPRFASKLGLSGITEAKAIEIIQKLYNNGLITGREPTGIAAASLYVASVLSGEKKTQRDVAEIAGVTEVTIRNRYKELSEQLDIIV
ncbi:MAG: transcription initiation factor IIB [Methanobrevibacter sp.]|nr:transcription initiation factor IIB [Methanobrevibacter sp.]MBQ3415250.1 transcription initiation factor IIB [Clostridia bacterium]MBQ6098942.1 transcription initiation factor IIB [Methanobrevibacter sp.]